MNTAPGIAKRLDTASRPILRLRVNGVRVGGMGTTPKDRNVAGGEMRTTLPADCPTCGAKGYEPCRVLSHRDERERPDHAARKRALPAKEGRL